ncbi:MAG: hypothetical protein ACD_63C00022G0003 [uncultured bacterium]|nr:MAG: hypothetical protein ACD_63C00022G0003 [uncultured bacterium]
MKVLFIYPDFPEGKKKAGDEEWGFYSEGLASVSSVLKEAGHDVELYHLREKVSRDEFLSTVKKHKPDLVSFSLRTNNLPDVVQYIPFLKKEMDVPIICGSYHATLFPEEILKISGVDMVCIGEAEYPMRDLCDAMEAGKPYDNIKSIWVKTKDGIRKNPIMPLVENLDDLPLPDFDLFDFKNLTSSKIYTAGVMLSRGCFFNCTYCCNHTVKNLYPNKNKYHRVRSPENSIKYLKKLLKNHRYIKYITFWDNNLSLPRDWCVNFLKLYKKEIKLPFGCNLHPETVDEELVKLLKGAGCYRVHFGVESGNEEFRRRVLRRNMKNSQIKKAFALCRKYGISTLAYNMINCPMETPRETLDTVKLNAKIKATRSLAPVFYPFPGTEAYKMSLKNKLFKPSVNYTEDILLKNPNYPESQVEFFSLYFRPLVKTYKTIYKLPKGIGKICEKSLDRALSSKYLPFKMLNIAMKQERKLLNASKNTLKNKMPKLYVKMRNLRLGKK